MTVDGLDVPAPSPCACGADVLHLVDYRGRPVTLDATPTPGGRIRLHGLTGTLVAQSLGSDAASAFRRASQPLYREHRHA